MPGLPELLVILVIVLVMFGANKLPGIGDALGRTIKNFKKASSTEDETDAEPVPTKRALAAARRQDVLEGADDNVSASDDGEWEEVVVRRKKKSV